MCLRGLPALLCLLVGLCCLCPLSSVRSEEPAETEFTSLLLADPLRVSPAGSLPEDARLAPLRQLRDPFHPWTPPTRRDAWEAEAQRLREQVLVGIGLWPLPERTELNPVVHGRVDRGDYTVEKVYFASRPGHYVTGSLYRPKGEGPFPGILSPHGHWANGRFYDAGEAGAAQQLATSAETYASGARYPLQARFVQLARMGCVVFHYDMIGYADSRSLPHNVGFGDVPAQLELQSPMGLQTWNSMRALDFLISLDDVDPARIGVTGASGGGTQTFMLCALDERPAAAFPAVMVSTAMQGGCQCENACYLRVGINNVALAALFAPRPQAMSGADDWTIDIETRGLPELKQVYALYDAAARVNAVCFPQFPHNYNEPAREMMYHFFNEALGLNLPEPIKQTDFWPLTQEELTVFNEAHPYPEDALGVEPLRAFMTAEARQTLAQAAESLAGDGAAYRNLVGTAARVMLDAGVPAREELEWQVASESTLDGMGLLRAFVGRAGAREQIPVVALFREGVAGGEVLVWVHPQGKVSLLDATGGLRQEVRQLLDRGYILVAPDLFLTGEYLTDGRSDRLDVSADYPPYTFCYNRPLLAQRVRDILTIVGAVRSREQVTAVHLVGLEEAGPWTLLARALAGDSVTRIMADARHFSFGQVTDPTDPMLLPGGLKYGDLDGLVALSAPARLDVWSVSEHEWTLTRAAYQSRGTLTLHEQPLTIESLLAELLQ